MPQPLTLTTPGRWGVNEQEQNQLLHPNWATKADGLVINDSGNLQCRGALNLISSDNATAEILRQFIYVNSAGNETVISTTATKIISGIADLDDASTDITPTGAPTNGYWQFQNFNGKVVGWQAGHTPIVWSGSGDFAVITAATGTLPDGDCVLSAWGRLWAVDDDGQTIRICALLDETKWATADGGASIDMRNVWPKGMDRVVAIAAFGANLIIFGRRSIVVYTDGSGSALGVDPTQMYVVDTIDTGCACRDSVSVVGEGDLLFLSEVGLQSLGRVIQSKDNPLTTISWQIADRLSAAIKTEIVSATDLRTWTGSYIPGTGQYMLVHTTTEDVYAFHYGGMSQDDKGRTVVPLTIWDTSILTNIRGFITRRSGITYTTGGANDIYQYDTSLSLDEGDVAIAVTMESGWLDLGGEFSQVNKLLKMVQVTVLNPAVIDTALTLRYAADYSTDIDTLTHQLSQPYQRCVFLFDPSGDIEGQYFKLGFSDTSFGRKELTQIMAQFKTGRTGFIHKRFPDVVDESYVAATAPVLTLLSPDSAIPDSGAFTLTITGTGFTVDSIAYWDGSARVTTFVSSTSLTVAILAGDVDDEDTFDVTVVNVVGGESNALPFEVADTFALWDAATAGVSIGVSGAGLIISRGGSGNWESIRSDIGKSSGKWYWEYVINSGDPNNVIIGVGDSTLSSANYVGSGVGSRGFQAATSAGHILTYNNSGTGGITSSPLWVVGDVLQIALDMSAGSVWIGFNGTWRTDSGGGANPAIGLAPNFTGLAGTFYAAASMFAAAQITANFGDSAFAYTPPSGFAGLSA